MAKRPPTIPSTSNWYLKKKNCKKATVVLTLMKNILEHLAEICHSYAVHKNISQEKFSMPKRLIESFEVEFFK